MANIFPVDFVEQYPDGIGSGIPYLLWADANAFILPTGVGQEYVYAYFSEPLANSSLVTSNFNFSPNLVVNGTITQPSPGTVQIPVSNMVLDLVYTLACPAGIVSALGGVTQAPQSVTFNGVPPASGLISTPLIPLVPYITSTAITNISNGTTLPTGTINVVSTVGFPTSGIINVQAAQAATLVVGTGTSEVLYTANIPTTTVSTNTALPATSIPVVSTTGFPSTGTVFFNSTTGPQQFFYTSTTGISFVGSSQGTGEVISTTLVTPSFFGSNGNNITVSQSHSGALSVSVNQFAITVEINFGTTTAAQVATAVNAATTLVTATTPSGGAGIAATAFIANLSGGSNALTQSVSYTNITPTSFTGAAGGIGTLIANDLVSPAITTTLVGSASNTAVLPQSIINVISTTGFPTSGTLSVQTIFGFQKVFYTGTTATSFTGCSGGYGALFTGDAIENAVASPMPSGIVTKNTDSVSPSHNAQILLPSVPYPLATAITQLSNNTFLPTGTINVVSTANFPSSGSLTVQAAEAATLAIGTGTSEVFYTAAFVGPRGNAITIAHVAGLAFSVLVDQDFILVTIVYGTTTAAQVALAVNADAPSLVTATTPGGGAGIAAYSQVANLSGGTNTSNQTVTYTGITATSFTGCSGGAGALLTNNLVSPTVTTTSITNASNNLVLPQSVLQVLSTVGFPTSGTIAVQTNTGFQLVTYTGTSGTSFTGCVGGTGTIYTGYAIVNGTLAAWAIGLSTPNVDFVSPSAFGEILIPPFVFGPIAHFQQKGLSLVPPFVFGIHHAPAKGLVLGLEAISTITASTPLPATSITVSSTVGFSTTGTITFLSIVGGLPTTQTFVYSSITGNTFHGASQGVGTAPPNTIVTSVPFFVQGIIHHAPIIHPGTQILLPPFPVGVHVPVPFANAFVLEPDPLTFIFGIHEIPTKPVFPGFIITPPLLQLGPKTARIDSLARNGWILQTAPIIQLASNVFAPPSIEDLYPPNGATNVPINVTVSFSLIDYLYGIDPNSITIWNNSGSGYNLVFINGLFQPGFTGTFIEINPPLPGETLVYPKISFTIQSTTIYPRNKVIEWRLQCDDPTVFPWSWTTVSPAPRTEFRVAHGPIVTPSTMVPTYNTSDVQVFVNSSTPIGIGNGTQVTFSGSLGATSPGTIKILDDGYVVGSDNGTMSIIGNNISFGTINYTNGNFTITFIAAPISSHPLTATYGTPSTPVAIESLNPFENTIILSTPVPVGATVYADYSWFDHPILALDLNNPDNLLNESGRYGETPCTFVLNGPVYQQPQQNQISWTALDRDLTYGLNSPLHFTLNQPTNKLFDPITGIPISGKAVLNYGLGVKSYDLVNPSALPTTLNEGTPIVPQSLSYWPVYTTSGEISEATFQSSPNLWQSYDAIASDQDYLGFSTGGSPNGTGDTNYGRKGLSLGLPIDPIYTVTHAGSGSGTVNVTGWVTSPYEVIVRIITPGPIGNAMFVYSIDDGVTFTEPILVPADGIYEITVPV